MKKLFRFTRLKKEIVFLIRNQELIPVDGILINGNAQIDYSFVTGEANPVQKKSGDKLFAGGKQLSGAIEIEAINSVEQSYLTQLWSNAVFEKDKTSRFTTITNKISKNFTHCYSFHSCFSKCVLVFYRCN